MASFSRACPYMLGESPLLCEPQKSLINHRLGMHLLFYGREQVKLLESKKVEDLLRQESIKVLLIFSERHGLNQQK